MGETQFTQKEEMGGTHQELDIESKVSSWEDRFRYGVADSWDSESMGMVRVRYFKARFRWKEKTWVISLFVVLSLVAFIATMFVNDCPTNSHGDCILKSLHRFSFQPLDENPLLGPSSSTLRDIGALQGTKMWKQHEQWRLVTCIWLHAGVFHLVVNLSSIIFIGIRLEKEFGPLRIAIIYTLSACFGSLVSALFVQNCPAVGASAPTFGLLGAMLSGLIRNWSIYADKFPAFMALSFITTINLFLGLLPHVDNFANIGGFLSGILLGFMLFTDPQVRQFDGKMAPYDHHMKSSIKFEHKLDKPALRIVSLVIFLLGLIGALLSGVYGINANQYCSWCRYLNCVPIKKWSCNEKDSACEAYVSNGEVTLTCDVDGKFRTYPFAHMSKARMRDLCNHLCS
ncbi:RHOMBOID-like protein 8 isoform X2 [Amborella trichopoda]|nr:RHOMBOID-like protein 8 isoform X2 [Amborella trichopoda]|eukprot:XP_006859216.2 RHOMBOID-like protein 8 isoform X2 [Amborella trichopoda]